jgi:transposase
MKGVPSMRKPGKILTQDEKWMILHVFQQCEEERKHAKTVRTVNAYQRASDYTGVSRKTVVEIAAYFRHNRTIPPPRQAGNRTNHSTFLGGTKPERIRRYIFERHRQGEACNSKHIQDLFHEEIHAAVHIRSVRRYLNRLGFQYTRTKRKPRALREKPYVRQQRHSYLHDIRQYRHKGYSLVYLDESFLHHYHGQQFSWFEDDIDWIERPSGKGRRWCFIHAMQETGLLPNCFLIFEGKKRTEDYHGSFNFEVFYSWFTERLLPNLSQKSCIVLDRAPYHMVPEERIVPNQIRKAEIQTWLTKHNIGWEEHGLKPKLIDMIDKHIDHTPLVVKEARTCGHDVRFLPVHHPELSPIELVWARGKNTCAKQLRSGVSFQEVRKNLEDAFAELTEETCLKLYEHVKRKEDEYWDLDLELEVLDDERSETILETEGKTWDNGM